MKMDDEAPNEAHPTWWRRWVVNPVVKQLTVGQAPEKIGWTIALGVVLGIFPIMGSTTLISWLVGWIFGLNQPIMQIFRTLVYPLHLALILVFIRMGERLFGVPLISLSIPELLTRFKEDPVRFAGDFGMAAFHGVTAWVLVAPFLILLIKYSITPLLKRVAQTITRRGELPT